MLTMLELCLSNLGSILLGLMTGLLLMMIFGVQLSMKTVPVKCQTITELANMLGAYLPFQSGLSNNTIHFPLIIVGPTVKQGECSNISFCILKHQCVQCATQHATVTCREWISNNGKSANTSKSKPAGTYS